MIKYLLAVLLLTNYVKAEELIIVPLDLVIVERLDITTNKQIDIIIEAISRAVEVGIYFDIRRINVVKDRVKKNNIKDFVRRLKAWAKYSLRKKIRSPKVLTHFSLPLLVDNKGNQYQGGLASGYCTTKHFNSAFRYSYSILVKHLPEESKLIVLHELLHNEGAFHESDLNNLMYDKVAYQGIKFKDYVISERTKAEVANCQKLKASI